MVYIFGIDVPIMETMAILVILIFIVLVIAFLEIFRLRKLIQMERKNSSEISTSEKGPVHLYGKQAEPPAPKKKQSFFAKMFGKKEPERLSPKLAALENYIRSGMQRKVDEKVMVQALLGRGWKKEEIDKALKDVKGKKK